MGLGAVNVSGQTCLFCWRKESFIPICNRSLLHWIRNDIWHFKTNMHRFIFDMMRETERKRERETKIKIIRDPDSEDNGVYSYTIQFSLNIL